MNDNRQNVLSLHLGGGYGLIFRGIEYEEMYDSTVIIGDKVPIEGLQRTLAKNPKTKKTASSGVKSQVDK